MTIMINLFLHLNLNYNLCCPLVHVNKPKRSNVSWMTPALICSSKPKNKLYIEFLKGKVLAETYKTYRNKFNNIFKACKTQYFNNIIDKHRKNAKAMWNMLNNCLGRSKPAKSPNIGLPNMNHDALNTFFLNLALMIVKILNPLIIFQNICLAKLILLCLFSQSLLNNQFLP